MVGNSAVVMELQFLNVCDRSGCVLTWPQCCRGLCITSQIKKFSCHTHVTPSIQLGNQTAMVAAACRIRIRC